MPRHESKMELYSQIYELTTLKNAFDKIKANKGIRGIDGVDIDPYKRNLPKELSLLQKTLKDHSYQPAPLLQYSIPKGDESKRFIAVPTVRDRVVHRAIHSVLTPVIEPMLSQTSFGFRKGRSTKDAINFAVKRINNGFKWLVKVDIDSFFESIDHTILSNLLRNYLEDEQIIQLIAKLISIQVCDAEGNFSYMTGIPQGSPLSPLLSNIYLDVLDKEAQKNGVRISRFADDILGFARDREEAGEILEFIELQISNLKLQVNKNKCTLSEYKTDFKYLGAIFLGDGKVASLLKPNESDNSSCNRFGDNSIRLFKTLYIQEQGVVLKKERQRLCILKKGEKIFSVPAGKVNQIIVFGNCHITIPAMRLFLINGIPVYLLSNYGKYLGRLISDNSAATSLIKEQLLKSFDHDFCLKISREIVLAKIHNERVFLQRNKNAHPEIEDKINQLQVFKTKVENAGYIEQLRGLEGAAQAVYYNAFKLLLKNPMGFDKRTRRPPKDPVNSLLSFGYTLLFNNIYSFILINGLDPHLGYFHKNIRNNPSFASDLIEEFRTPIIDSLVLYLINSSIINESDFLTNEQDGAYILSSDAKKKFLKHFEDKMNTGIIGRQQGMKIDYRRHIDLQVKNAALSITKGQKYKSFRLSY
jgi:CRISPR-associated protein Cas1